MVVILQHDNRHAESRPAKAPRETSKETGDMVTSRLPQAANGTEIRTSPRKRSGARRRLPLVRDARAERDHPELDDYEVPFKGIVEQSIAGIYILQDGRFRYVNETFARMCGLKREQLMGARLCDVANPAQSSALVEQYERRIHDDAPDDSFIIRRTSRRRPGSFEIHGTRVIFHGRPAIVGVGVDITEQERQRGELIAAGQRLRELVANANFVRENERNRVARELHDVVGGMLTAIKFDLSRMAWGIERVDPPVASGRRSPAALHALAETAQEIIRLTQDTIEAVRSISEGLRPGALDHLGLSETISQSLKSFEHRYGISSRLRPLGTPCTLDRDTEIGIYRIFQEALTNVARHSKATEVLVDLVWKPSGLTLEIADNGLGFDPEHPPVEDHLGLAGMQERARELGGTVAFGIGPRCGALIRLHVPAANSADRQGDIPDDSTAAD